MKFSEKEIIGGGIFSIIIIALLFNIFWASPNNINFCGDNICEEDEIGSCKVDCNWCGDGFCQNGENCDSCSEDCGACGSDSFCGDGICGSGECGSGCWKDCSYNVCENGVCEIEKGEDCVNSPNDCRCGEGYCNEINKRCDYQSCGNKICEEYETTLNCPNDCKEKYQVEDNSDINYPIIFVHGHSFTDDSSESSINTFKEFQEKLSSDGYGENKGIVLPKGVNLAKGSWGKINKPVIIRTTYYLNAYDEFGSTIGLEDNQYISVYAQRLGDVIDEVLKATDKNKVVIISHSMGGLISRYYIKNEGGLNKVDKLVTIGTPNHGIYGDIASGCESLFSRSEKSPECDDMKNVNNFIDNLNSGDETPGDIEYLTIRGEALKGASTVYLVIPINACSTSSEYHDEVVCSSSVGLEGATNKKVTGQEVTGKGTFHGALVSPSKVPEVYNYVVDFLN